MGKKSKIVRSFMMVSQIGMSMLVPIFLFLGMGAGFRNTYYLTKSFYEKDRKREHEQLAYIENLKKAGERNKQKRENRESTTESKTTKLS